MIFVRVVFNIILLKSHKPDKTEPSEELYCQGFRAIQTLLTRTDASLVLENLFAFKHLTSLGLLVSICLDALCLSSSTQVRLESLKCLKSLVRHNVVFDRHEPCVALVFASFLPGIVIKVGQQFLLAQNLTTLSHKLVCNCLDLLGTLIARVFNDTLLDAAYYKNAFDACSRLSSASESTMSADVRQLIVNRAEDKRWAESSAEKLFLLVERVLDALLASESGGERVKLSLVQFCSLVASECYSSLNKHLSGLLRVLVTFSATDSFETTQVAAEACRGLELMAKHDVNNNSNNNNEHFFSMVSNCLEEVLLKLPREAFRSVQLRTLHGYLKLVGETSLVEFFRLNRQRLSQLLQALSGCVSFDHKSLSDFFEVEKVRVSNSSSVEPAAHALSSYAGMKTYLDDQSVFDQLRFICEYLGRSNAIRLLIDELLTNQAWVIKSSILNLIKERSRLSN